MKISNSDPAGRSCMCTLVLNGVLFQRASRVSGFTPRRRLPGFIMWPGSTSYTQVPCLHSRTHLQLPRAASFPREHLTQSACASRLIRSFHGRHDCQTARCFFFLRCGSTCVVGASGQAASTGGASTHEVAKWLLKTPSDTQQPFRSQRLAVRF